MNTFTSFVARNANKVRAAFYEKLGEAADVADTYVAAPLLDTRTKVVGTVSETLQFGVQTVKETATAGVDIIKNYKLILLVLALAAVAYLFGPLIRSFSRGR